MKYFEKYDMKKYTFRVVIEYSEFYLIVKNDTYSKIKDEVYPKKDLLDIMLFVSDTDLESILINKFIEMFRQLPDLNILRHDLHPMRKEKFILKDEDFQWLGLHHINEDYFRANIVGII